MEPVDGGAVDDGGELARAHPQCGTHGREAQNHLCSVDRFLYYVSQVSFVETFTLQMNCAELMIEPEWLV